MYTITLTTIKVHKQNQFQRLIQVIRYYVKFYVHKTFSKYILYNIEL